MKWLTTQDLIDKVGTIETKNSKVNDKLTDPEYNGLMQFVDDPIIGTWIRFARYTGYRLSEIQKVYLSEDGYYKAVGKRGKEKSFCKIRGNGPVFISYTKQMDIESFFIFNG